MDPERRRHPRLNAPILWRVAGLRTARAPVDLSLGGMRMYSDDALEVGTRLELELLVPGEEKIEFVVRVVWVDALPAGSPARYDVGFEFLSLDAVAAKHLGALLSK